ncbi:MAG: signal peptide peptidase SppA [Parvularcula sp.]
MHHERSRLTVWGFIKGLFKVVIGFSLLIQSLLFIVLMVTIFAVISSFSDSMTGKGEGPDITVPKGGALVLNPQGVLVEVAPPTDPVEEALKSAFGSDSEAQVSVHDLVRAVRAAKDDDRIKAMVLDLQGLYIPSIYASKAHYLADEIEAFRESGKQVVAIGDSYNQEQYLIASEANTVLMNDMGMVFINGYGSYRTYFKSAMDMLGVTGHVFRVGTFKSALEPFMRDDMSPAAKEANMAFLGTLWDDYTSAVEGNRGLQSGSLSAAIQNLPATMEAVGGDAARAAVDMGLVDKLLDRGGQVDFIAGIVGRDEDDEAGFKGISYETYLISVPDAEDREKIGNVAVVTAAGEILDGEQPVGVVGGDTLSAELREARLDDDVKAVVLRVDSPGGSAFASEIIRDELLKLKEAKKPVVVSMGSLAASGGYWISTSADEIWAAPTTVTGSIGVFGFIPTFENALDKIGVHTDGVGTTPLASINAIGPGPLPEEFGVLVQQSVEDIYRRFLGIVSEGRGMSTSDVDRIAQGRVWIGSTAKELNLVDKIGDIDDAIASAAKRAGLDDYDVVGISDDKTPFEMFLEHLAGAEAQSLVDQDISTQLFGGTSRRTINIERLISYAQKEAAFYASFNDPNATYVRCMECGAR